MLSHVPVSIGSSVSPSSTNFSFSTEASALFDLLGNGSDEINGDPPPRNLDRSQLLLKKLSKASFTVYNGPNNLFKLPTLCGIDYIKATFIGDM